MTRKLRGLKTKIEKETTLLYFYGYSEDSDGEITLNHSVMSGFNAVYSEKVAFNACDYQTNKNGFYEEIKKMENAIADFRSKE